MNQQEKQQLLFHSLALSLAVYLLQNLIPKSKEEIEVDLSTTARKALYNMEAEDIERILENYQDVCTRKGRMELIFQDLRNCHKHWHCYAALCTKKLN